MCPMSLFSLMRIFNKHHGPYECLAHRHSLWVGLKLSWFMFLSKETIMLTQKETFWKSGLPLMVV